MTHLHRHGLRVNAAGNALLDFAPSIMYQYTMLAVNANQSQPPTRALRVRFPACADDADYELLVEERPGQARPVATLRVTGQDGQMREMAVDLEPIARA